MPSLLIVYHSQSGTCADLARAAAEGARQEEGVQVLVQRACDAGVRDLAAADGLLLVAAENSGSLSGGAKEFLDRIFYPAIDQSLVLPYALFRWGSGREALLGLPIILVSAAFGLAGNLLWIDPVNELYFIGMVQIFDRNNPAGRLELREASSEAIYGVLQGE